MQGTVSYDGASSEPFKILSGVKQGCVLAPTLFGIFYSMLLNLAFRHSDEGVHRHTRGEGKLFNLARLKGMTEVRTVLIKEMLFADDAALTSHTEEAFQQLISKFAYAALIWDVKKTNVMDVTASTARYPRSPTASLTSAPQPPKIYHLMPRSTNVILRLLQSCPS